jgi:uncharacterized membrane protein
MGFSPGSAVRFGWETFKKRPGLFVGAFLLIVLAQVVVELVSRAVDAPFGGAESDYAFLGALISLACNTLISMGVTAFALAAYDKTETAELSALWHPHPFWKYLGLTILFSLIIVAMFLLGFALVTSLGRDAALVFGVPLLVVLLVILSLMLLFSGFLVIDRGLGPIQALKESHRITRGHKWGLFVLSLLLVLVNLAGLLALVVGIFVSGPVTLMALTHAYRVLGGGVAPRPADAALAA